MWTIILSFRGCFSLSERIISCQRGDTWPVECHPVVFRRIVPGEEQRTLLAILPNMDKLPTHLTGPGPCGPGPHVHCWPGLPVGFKLAGGFQMKRTHSTILVSYGEVNLPS